MISDQEIAELQARYAASQEALKRRASAISSPVMRGVVKARRAAVNRGREKFVVTVMRHGKPITTKSVIGGAVVKTVTTADNTYDGGKRYTSGRIAPRVFTAKMRELYAAALKRDIKADSARVNAVYAEYRKAREKAVFVPNSTPEAVTVAVVLHPYNPDTSEALPTVTQTRTIKRFTLSPYYRMFEPVKWTDSEGNVLPEYAGKYYAPDKLKVVFGKELPVHARAPPADNVTLDSAITIKWRELIHGGGENKPTLPVLAYNGFKDA